MNANNLLTLDMLGPAPLLTRQKKVMPRYSPDQDYFRQAIQVYDESGKRVLSKFIELIKYSTGCKMCMVLNKEIIYPHAFEVWEHNGDDFKHNGKFKVVDLCTGNILPGWVYNPETQTLSMTSTEVKEGFCPLCKKEPSKYCASCECVCVTPKVERDIPNYNAYSVALRECLLERSLQNTPDDRVEFYKEYYKTDPIRKYRLPNDYFEEQIVEELKEIAMEEIELSVKESSKDVKYHPGFWSSK